MNENNVEMTAAEMLRNARTTGRRKREIPTIAKQLCIREEFLEALESGNYHQIPKMRLVVRRRGPSVRGPDFLPARPSLCVKIGFGLWRVWSRW